MDELGQIAILFRKVFEDDSLVISVNTSAKDIEAWNSLEHVKLIAAIEKCFGIRFSFPEIMQFECVGDILTCIQKKRGNAV